MNYLLNKKALIDYAMILFCTFLFVIIAFFFQMKDNFLLLLPMGIFVIVFFLINRVLLIAFFISLSFFDFTIQGLTYFKLLGYLLLSILVIYYFLGQVKIDLNDRMIILFLVIFLICCVSQLVNRIFIPFYLNKILMLFCMLISLTVFIKRINELKTVLFILGVAGFIAACITIFEVLLNPGIERASGSLGNANNTGAIFCMLLPFSILIFREKKRFIFLFFSFLFIITLIVAIYITASRSAVINLIFITLLSVSMYKWKGKILTIPLLLAATFLFFSVFENYRGIERYQRILTGGGVLESEVVKVRMEITKIGLTLFFENPVLGIGSGNFQGGTKNMETENFGYLYAGIAPHNMYTQILAELGIIGFIFFIWFYFTIFEYLVSGIRQSDPEIKLVSMVLLFSFVSLMISMISSGNYLKPFLYVIAGFALVIKDLASHKSNLPLRSNILN